MFKLLLKGFFKSMSGKKQENLKIHLPSSLIFAEKTIFVKNLEEIEKEKLWYEDYSYVA